LTGRQKYFKILQSGQKNLEDERKKKRESIIQVLIDYVSKKCLLAMRLIYTH
jgi:hypothetical protein